MGYCFTFDVLFYLYSDVCVGSGAFDTIVPESLFYVKQDINFPEFGHMWFTSLYSDLASCTHKDTQITQGLIG